MKKIKKFQPEDDSTSFDDLPDEIAYQILSKLSDLKFLCICQLVCKRFYRTVLQVEGISFTSVTHPLIHPPNMEMNVSITATLLRSFESAMISLKKFTRVKSICIQLSPPFENPLLFKWKIKFGNKVDSLLLLSPTSFSHNNNFKEKNHEKEDFELSMTKRNIASLCWMDAKVSHAMLLCCIEHVPLLENISITDPGKRRMISCCGEKITQIRNCLTPPFVTLEQKLLNRENVPRIVGHIWDSLLDLPISGYVMNGVTLILMERYDVPNDISLLKTEMLLDDEYEDKEELAYTEAMNKMLKKLKWHKSLYEHFLVSF